MNDMTEGILAIVAASNAVNRTATEQALALGIPNAAAIGEAMGNLNAQAMLTSALGKAPPAPRVTSTLRETGRASRSLPPPMRNLPKKV